MALDGITGSGNTAALRGADAPARAGSVLSTLATRPRFTPLDAFQVATRPDSQRARKATDRPPADDTAAPLAARDGADSGQTPSRAVTAFLVQSLAQEQDQASGPAVPVSQISAGLRAYARSTGTAAPQADSGIEVIPPQLSSGHALDLAV